MKISDKPSSTLKEKSRSFNVPNADNENIKIKYI